MKLVVVITLLFTLLFGATTSFAYTEANITSSKDVTFIDGGVIVDIRTVLPMRKIFETLGATVDWDSSTRTVHAYKDGISLELPIGSNQVVVNGEVKHIDVPAIIIGSSTMVPVRFIGETLNAQVDWDSYFRTATITQSDQKVFVYVDNPSFNYNNLGHAGLNNLYQLMELYDKVDVELKRLERQSFRYDRASEIYRQNLSEQIEYLKLQREIHTRMSEIVETF